MPNKPLTPSDARHSSGERTSQTDDQRIKDVTPLPPPEHLIRFFPIAGSAAERLIGQTREAVRQIMKRKDVACSSSLARARSTTQPRRSTMRAAWWFSARVMRTRWRS